MATKTTIELTKDDLVFNGSLPIRIVGIEQPFAPGLRVLGWMVQFNTWLLTEQQWSERVYAQFAENKRSWRLLDEVTRKRVGINEEASN